jgi:uncharacterized protein (TIGR02231 family)
MLFLGVFMSGAPMKPNGVNDDAALIRRAKEGSMDAFEALIKRRQRRVYAICRRMTGAHQSADDMARETFIKVYLTLNRFIVSPNSKRKEKRMKDIGRHEKRTALLAAVLIAVMAGSGLAQEADSELAAKSRVTAVTVFPDRATIIREADLDLDPSVKTVLFKGLPASILPSSIRVTGKGTAAVKLLSIDILDQFLESPLLPELKKLQAELESVEVEIQKINNTLAVVDAQEKFLGSIGASTASQASEALALGRADVASWDRVIEFLGTKLSVLKSTRLESQSALKEKAAKAEALRKKIESLRPRQPLKGKTAVANIEVGKSGSFKIALSYTVAPAGWRPRYNLRALPDTSEIELGMFGEVSQRSGEDWNDARASLSTSSPSLGARPSDLPPWLVDIYVPRPAEPMMARRTKNAAPSVAGGVMAEKADMAVEAEPVMEAEIDTAALVDSGLHLNFEIRREVDIPSDGAPHKFPIDARTLKVKYDYVTVPKQADAVYLRGTLRNSLEYPLISGMADLFVDQDFVGSMPLPQVASGDEAKLYFGADPQIKVTREQIRREKNAPGFLGKNEKVRLVYKVTLQNFRKTTAMVEVLDQIPVSQNSKIEVKDVSLQPAPAKREESGLLTWQFSLAPQEKKEILIDFTVEYPKDSNLVNF